MKYQDLLKQVTPLPLHVNDNKDCYIRKDGIAVAECFNRGTETPCISANAKLLAHSANVLPQAQTALHQVLAAWLRGDTLDAGSPEYDLVRDALLAIENVNV